MKHHAQNEDLNNDSINAQSKKDIFADRLCFVTRALVKNNIVKQNLYMLFLFLEFIARLYYVLRLADSKNFLRTFQPLEHFLDIGTNNEGE